jgi:hypothetical protein
MGTNENEKAAQLTKQGFSHPVIGSETALGISAKVSRGVARDLTRNTRSISSPFMVKGRLRAFLKGPSAKIAWLLLNLSKN